MLPENTSLLKSYESFVILPYSKYFSYGRRELLNASESSFYRDPRASNKHVLNVQNAFLQNNVRAFVALLASTQHDSFGSGHGVSTEGTMDFVTFEEADQRER